ncbi:MAG: class I SAM-dependent methyltransferase [Candidatus Nomurabacteria bacterium]|jgi:SAM-dependent methyltransferase|nr:class I SAM-dependent methyltransferase [Candidatus Nomurabacteria bacterium]
MTLAKFIDKQFHNPDGFWGRFCMGTIMPIFNHKLWTATYNHIDEKKKVLEIGFGSGQLLRKVAKKSTLCFGVDPSATAIKQAAKRNNKFIKDGIVKLEDGTAENIPFDEKFGIIYTINTLYFWDSMDNGLQSIKSKLTDGGQFINAFYTKERLDKLSNAKDGYNKFTLDEVVGKTKANGYSVEIVEIEKDASYLIIGTKDK